MADDRRLLWCGDEICQSRTPIGSVLREYLAEGENVPGGSKLFYGMDHQGSVRRVFNATASHSYDYDPYGRQIQLGAPVTDFTYAGLMALPESGLYLSSTRAYNPGVGRWLRRDMAGEAADPDANLYGYANRDPVNLIDPTGYAASSLLKDALRQAAAGAIKGLYESWKEGASDWQYGFCEVGSTLRSGVIGFRNGFIAGLADHVSSSPVTDYVSNTATDTGGLKDVARSRVTFQGMEVRAVRDLSHLSDSTLNAMADIGFSAKTPDGDVIILHHHRQNPNGFLVEMPSSNHSISNKNQHPFGNQKGLGLTSEQRESFNKWRNNYWRARARAELHRRSGL